MGSGCSDEIPQLSKWNTSSENSAVIDNGKSKRSSDSLKHICKEGVKHICKEGVSLNDFHVLDFKIGEGGFAKVMKVRHVKSKEVYACKVLSKRRMRNERQVVNIFIERGILIRLRHPFIVSLQYAFQTKEKLFLVVDYCAGGDFFHYLQQRHRFSERDTRFYASEICLGLEALHKSDIIHRDLKPENILITKAGHLKITDFGLSKWGGKRRKEELRAKTFLGSAPYLAPEILDEDAKQYTNAVDWWAFGILIMEMLTGLPAFYEQNSESNYKRIMYESVAFKSHISRPARSILLDLLEKDPSTRLKEASDVKKHEFFYRTDWKATVEMTVPIPKDWQQVPIPEDDASGSERISDYYQSRMKTSNEKKDASTTILGDPFMGFTYHGDSKVLQFVHEPEADFKNFARDSRKEVADLHKLSFDSEDG